MKAVVYSEYGSPDVLRIEEVAKPTPKENEVLVKVEAMSANPADWHLMRGEPFLARLEFGLFKPQKPILGADIAGVVEAVGRNVTALKVGDAVFGDLSAYGFGGFAEYVAVPESAVVLKPAKLSFEQAAAVPLAAITALQGLRMAGQIQRGQKVLVNGASGGVGSFAVQIAKASGAEVTGVCSTRNLELVRSMGADHVIDYTQEDFTQTGPYDVIFDAVGNRSALAYRRALKPNGQCMIVGFTTLFHLFFQSIFMAMLVSMLGSKKVRLMGTAHANKQDMLALKELLETGKMSPVIDRCYPFHETAEAIRYLEQGRARGKVVIRMENAYGQIN